MLSNIAVTKLTTITAVHEFRPTSTNLNSNLHCSGFYKIKKTFIYIYIFQQKVCVKLIIIARAVDGLLQHSQKDVRFGEKINSFGDNFTDSELVIFFMQKFM